MPRLLTTSASACRQLARKAELMGVDTAALEAQESQLVALVDVRKKWHIAPAFSVEFIGYYLDRNLRVTSMKRRLQELLDINSQLLNEQQRLDRKYDEVMKDNEEQIRVNVTLKEKIELYHQVLKSAGYMKPLPSIADLAKPRIAPTLGKSHVSLPFFRNEFWKHNTNTRYVFDRYGIRCAHSSCSQNGRWISAARRQGCRGYT
jgi:hypothetical protein